MKRYLNSLFITIFIYICLTIFIINIFEKIKIEPKKDENLVKISLNNVIISEEKIDKIEEVTNSKPLNEKIVEKPALKKAIDKQKTQKVVQKDKITEKTVEKTVEKAEEKSTEKIENENIEDKKVNNEPIDEKSLETSTKQINNTNIENLENEYLAKVKNKIERNKIYPKMARRLNQTGKVLVSFDILKDGKIMNIKILQNSKFEALDEASIELLKNIDFFEAIPSELNKNIWNIQIPINYQIN